MRRNVVQDFGWGRLVFGQTFDDLEQLGNVLRAEESGRRDIAMYMAAPHVFVALNPHEYFIDPSYTYRIRPEDWDSEGRPVPGVTIRRAERVEDLVGMNRIYVRCHMVPADLDLMWENRRHADAVTYLVAVDDLTGGVLGTVTGADHAELFSDPENGCSLWCLAVDPACTKPGVGELLTRALVEQMFARGRDHLDLSVMHDNIPAIRLYERLGFAREPILGVKRKNAINEHLYVPSSDEQIDALNPYARIIADEALRRGIAVEVLDAEGGYLKLVHGGTTVITRESLSERTSAIAMSRCDDKRVTRRVVGERGVRIPRGRIATGDDADVGFLDEVGSLVVKPVRGEQGAGITVGVMTHDALTSAIQRAREAGAEVLLEEHCEGQDLRIIVIDGRVVAAAIRRPAEVVGTGHHTIRKLIEAQSRRRAAATGGESSIPIDQLTEETVADGGWSLDEILPEGHTLVVRRTANLHTGGTIHDVTDDLNPALGAVAVRAAEAIGIPVTGIDLIVPDPAGTEYVFIEANERPGLANHEPHPTAQAFIDYLFPRTSATPWAWQPPTPESTAADTSGSGDAI